MKYYDSPIGRIILTADEEGLTGLWFEDQKIHPKIPEKEGNEKFISSAVKWLDGYFSGKIPNETVPVHLIGTDFQKEVWEILRTVPYGSTVTYGDISSKISEKRGSHMSAQAVGQAVGHNPVAVIVPCHRVIGKDGSLTGYAGGTERKRRMLEIEGHTIG